MDVPTASVIASSSSGFQARVWADALSDAVAMTLVSPTPLVVTVDLITWRTAPRPQSDGNTFAMCADYWGRFNISADEYVPLAAAPGSAAVGVRHDNGASAFVQRTLQQQGLAGDPLYDPVSHRVTGAAVWLQGGEVVNASRVATPTAACNVSVVVASASVIGVDAWTAAINAALDAAPAAASPSAFEAHSGAWNDTVWSQSYVDITTHAAVDVGDGDGGGADAGDAVDGGQDGAWVVSQQMALHRMLLFMQMGAAFPIKFNGMLWNCLEPFDDRMWGGSTWWQNVRLMYYALPAQGASDRVLSNLVAWYVATMPVAFARTRTFFGHAGLYFPETMTTHGTHTPLDYGCTMAQRGNLPASVLFGNANKFNMQQPLDLLTLVLDATTLYRDDYGEVCTRCVVQWRTVRSVLLNRHAALCNMCAVCCVLCGVWRVACSSSSTCSCCKRRWTSSRCTGATRRRRCCCGRRKPLSRGSASRTRRASPTAS